jgi:hypothetical protein
MAFCCTAGLLVVGQMMDEEMTERIGPTGRHLPDRVGTRNGTAAGFAVLGGRSVPIRRPRAAEVGGGEVHLDSYEVFSATDLMTEMAVERMLAGVSTRRHRLVAESLGEAIEEAARGDSKSAVSRRFVNATAAKLDELVHRDLSTLDVAVLMIDGIVFAKCCCVVTIVVTTDGTKVPVGLFEGDTENATVVTDLLADLVERASMPPRASSVSSTARRRWLPAAPAPVSCRQHPRGPGGDVHRPPARRPRPAGTHHDHYGRRRVDDLAREVARRAGEELARRHDGAALGRDRHVGGRAFLPPPEGL